MRKEARINFLASFITDSKVKSPSLLPAEIKLIHPDRKFLPAT